MLSLPKSYNRHGGKMLTAMPVQSNDNEKFDKSSATKYRKVRQHSGKSLTIVGLLALLLAIAIASPVLHAQNGGQSNGPDKVNDPTGAWLIRNDGSGFILTVFHKGGTLTGDVQGESAFDPAATNPPMTPFNVINSPESGVWQKTGGKTFAATFLTIEYQVDTSNNSLSAPLFQFDKVQFTGVLSESGDRMELTAAISFYDSSGNQIGDTIQVPTKAHGVRIPLEVLPNTSHTLPIPTP